LRRLLLVLGAAAIFSALVVATAAPVFADDSRCTPSTDVPCHATQTFNQNSPEEGNNQLHTTDVVTPRGITNVVTLGGNTPAQDDNIPAGAFYAYHCSPDGEVCQGKPPLSQ
jgi:hypothetical protein